MTALIAVDADEKLWLDPDRIVAVLEATKWIDRIEITVTEVVLSAGGRDLRWHIREPLPVVLARLQDVYNRLGEELR